MRNPPQSLMIFREELQKAKLEQKRLRREYSERLGELFEEMDELKRKIFSQEEMLKIMLNYSLELERKLKAFRERVALDEEQNSSGYH